jgi:hypothetical protein
LFLPNHRGAQARRSPLRRVRYARDGPGVGVGVCHDLIISFSPGDSLVMSGAGDDGLLRRIPPVTATKHDEPQQDVTLGQGEDDLSSRSPCMRPTTPDKQRVEKEDSPWTHNCHLCVHVCMWFAFFQRLDIYCMHRHPHWNVGIIDVVDIYG